jgi:Kef-type K+ transport system membrane component KefB
MTSDLFTILLQIVVVCSVARGVGALFARIRQPRVIGEIVAGIILGPSLLGWLTPSTSAFLFPPAGLGSLRSLSEVGVIIFMFLVGLEVDLREIRKMGPTVAITSGVSILMPFLGGIGLALLIHQRLANPGVPVFTFALFMGTAMSITAFPVLARILTERNMAQTKIGRIAISCAAVDDLVAWCLLALIVAQVRSATHQVPWFTFLGLVAYVLLMLFVVRKLLARIPSLKQSALSGGALGMILLFAFASACMTEWLGVHALFGAFFAGVVLPKTERLAHGIVIKLETVTTVLLLPLFFAFTGLRMNVRLLGSDRLLWLVCAVIILVAIAGKMLGSALPARATGLTWREAFSVGALVNTRGLVELVILNVGLELGLISPVLFSMMVLMTLTTTFMAGPLLDLLNGNILRARRATRSRSDANTLITSPGKS